MYVLDYCLYARYIQQFLFLKKKTDAEGFRNNFFRFIAYPRYGQQSQMAITTYKEYESPFYR